MRHLEDSEIHHEECTKHMKGWGTLIGRASGTVNMRGVIIFDIIYDLDVGIHGPA